MPSFGYVVRQRFLPTQDLHTTVMETGGALAEKKESAGVQECRGGPWGGYDHNNCRTV